MLSLWKGSLIFLVLERLNIFFKLLDSLNQLVEVLNRVNFIDLRLSLVAVFFFFLILNWSYLALSNYLIDLFVKPALVNDI
jgi:hypothetical protein